MIPGSRRPALVVGGNTNPAARALVALAHERNWRIAVLTEHAEGWSDTPFVTVCTVDLTDAAAVEAAFSTLTSSWGQAATALVYFAIADAPQTPARLAVTESADGWEATQERHLLAAFLFSQSGVREMLRLRGGKQVAEGSVVLVADVGAARSAPGFGNVSLSAAVAGLTGMTRQLAVEWGPFGVRVNMVHLGVSEGLTGRAADLLRRVPLARVADPRELAQSCYYLMSREASYVTGVVLPVDGGYHAT